MGEWISIVRDGTCFMEGWMAAGFHLGSLEFTVRVGGYGSSCTKQATTGMAPHRGQLGHSYSLYMFPSYIFRVNKDSFQLENDAD